MIKMILGRCKSLVGCSIDKLYHQTRAFPDCEKELEQAYLLKKKSMSVAISVYKSSIGSSLSQVFPISGNKILFESLTFVGFEDTRTRCISRVDVVSIAFPFFLPFFVSFFGLAFGNPLKSLGLIDPLNVKPSDVLLRTLRSPNQLQRQIVEGMVVYLKLWTEQSRHL
ncbi:unnamed protein product [Lepeophtheirus salmonis]|uniref:(salmon louse) hypothetical protein n=1 Tax=Lepeophtheirus salmonis TaxID=72036 RepID=A0A7R8CEF5_LEPSM|nr:unnamed protein product [Lepeophtheirus salmonis]CAF2795666.1 unnamed protein product [Lepeophtheirus salmonis]